MTVLHKRGFTKRAHSASSSSYAGLIPRACSYTQIVMRKASQKSVLSCNVPLLMSLFFLLLNLSCQKVNDEYYISAKIDGKAWHYSFNPYGYYVDQGHISIGTESIHNPTTLFLSMNISDSLDYYPVNGADFITITLPNGQQFYSFWPECGQLHITAYTSETVEATFYCRLFNGADTINVTNGRFRIKNDLNGAIPD